MSRMLTTRSGKLLSSVLVVGVLGSVSAAGVFGAFSATTQNSGNEISTGTVSLGDNDLGSAMFQTTNAEPGQSWTKCINVTYGGSLPADVTNYLRSTPGALSPYMHLKVERGTQTTASFPACGDFTPAAAGAVVYDAPFSDPTMPRDSASAVSEPPVGKTVWAQGDSLALRITLALDPAMPDTLQAATTGDASIVWEATNR